MNIVISKVFSSFALVTSAVIGSFIPSLMKKSMDKMDSEGKTSRREATICLTNCFAAGIIMGICFLHIFPETVEQFEHLKLFLVVNHNHLNLCFIFILMSFSFMLFLERVINFGRSPCCSTFNDCKTTTLCCSSKDEESLVALEAKDDEIVLHAQNTLSIPNPPRYKHKHSKILVTIKNILCPICDCNGLCITLGLFVHSVFEGLVVGLEPEETHMWLMTVGIVLHKWAAGMALASFLSGKPKVTTYIMFFIFWIGSPLGILIGSFILESNLLAISILNSLALGTLLYVGLEIIYHELFCEIKCRMTALYKWMSFIIGIGTIFASIHIQFILSEHAH